MMIIATTIQCSLNIGTVRTWSHFKTYNNTEVLLTPFCWGIKIINCDSEKLLSQGYKAKKGQSSIWNQNWSDSRAHDLNHSAKLPLSTFFPKGIYKWKGS